jgi:hypothetical protein
VLGQVLERVVGGAVAGDEDAGLDLLEEGAVGLDLLVGEAEHRRSQEDDPGPPGAQGPKGRLPQRPEVDGQHRSLQDDEVDTGELPEQPEVVGGVAVRLLVEGAVAGLVLDELDRVVGPERLLEDVLAADVEEGVADVLAPEPRHQRDSSHAALHPPDRLVSIVPRGLSA